MTKWARLRKRKERKRAEEALERSEAEGKEVKLAEPEKIPENIQYSQEIKKLEDTKTSSPITILSQIPRYAYLLAFFVLLAGIFYPLSYSFIDFDPVIQGTATLFLGLAGAVLLFKGVSSGKVRGIFIVVGVALIAISLALIFMLQEHTLTL
jgi:hypothetical protein